MSGAGWLQMEWASEASRRAVGAERVSTAVRRMGDSLVSGIWGTGV